MEILLIPDLWEHLIWHDAFILGQTCRLAKKALNQYRPTVEQRACLFERSSQKWNYTRELRHYQFQLDHFSKAIDQETEFRYSKPWFERFEGSVRLIRNDRKCLKSIKFYPTQELDAEIQIGGYCVADYNYSGPIADELFNRPLPMGGNYGIDYHPVDVYTNCPVEIEFVNLDFVKPCKPCTRMWDPICTWCNHCQVYLCTSKFSTWGTARVTAGLLGAFN